MDSPFTVSPQLLETLQTRQEARFLQDALSLYIPPQVGRYVGDETPQDTLDCISHWLFDNQSSCLLLLGDSGAGKTLFGQWLTRHCAQNSAFARRVPLFIPLLEIKHPHGNLLNDYLKIRLEIEDKSHRDAIQAQPLLLILDGFDEMRQRKNLFLSNELWRLNDVKVIISCRSQALAHEQNEKAFFYPYNKMEQAQPSQLKKYVMVPFTEKQIDAYLEHYVTTHQGDIKAKCLADLSANPNTHNWLEWKTYQTAIAQLPGLASFLKSPFILSVVVQILPTLFAKYQGKERIEQYRLVKIDLYDEFVKQWFARQKIKLLKSGHIKKDNCPIEEIFEKYSKGIANAMLQTHTTSIELTPQYLGPLLEQQGIFSENGALEIQKTPARPVKRLTNTAPQPSLLVDQNKKEIKEKKYIDADISVGNETLKLSIILSGCPVMKIQDNRYAFLHKSLLEYFAAKQLLEGVTAEASIAIGYELNERLLIDEPAILQFLAERVQQDDTLKQRLFDVINESKFDARVEIASANAITILNYAGVSFSEKKLRRVRIKGADLSGAILDSVDLRDADLRGVSFRGSWLNHAKLGGALMQKAEFGELAYLQCEGETCCIAYSPDGCYLAVGHNAGAIRLWDVVNGKLAGTFKGHTKFAFSVVFSADGSYLASGSGDCTVRLWDAASHKQLAELKGHTNAVNSVAFSPDGSCLASGSSDKTVRLWDVASLKEVAEMKRHGGAVVSVAFSPDGKTVASGSWDETVRLWNVASHQQVAEMNGHTGTVVSVAFSPDGSCLASGSLDKTVRLWNVTSHQQVAEMNGLYSVFSVVFSPDGICLASGSGSTVCLWDVASHQQVAEIKGHMNAVTKVAFSPDGSCLASGSFDHTVRLWNIASFKQAPQMKKHMRDVHSIAFSPDGSCLALGGKDCTVRLWDVASHKQLAEMKGHTNAVNGVAFSPDGSCLVSGSSDKTVCLWDVASYQQVAELKGHTNEVNRVAFSPDGSCLVSGSLDKTVRLWDVTSHKQLAEMNGHTEPVWSVAFSPDGSCFASGSFDKTVRLWDVTSHKQVAEMQAYNMSAVSSNIAFSPDGNRLAAGSLDKTVRLWNVASHKLVAEMKGHMNYVESVAFSPDGGHLASGSSDETVRLWNVKTGGCLNILKLTSSISALAFKKLAAKTYLCVVSGKAICYFEIKNIQSKPEFILLWSIGNESGLRSEQLDLGGVVGLEPQHERLLKQREAVGNLSQRETEKVLRERSLPIPYNPKKPPYNLFSQRYHIAPDSAMVNIVRKTKETEDGGDASKHVFLVIEHIENGFYTLTRADLYLDKTQKYSQGWIVTEGQALVEISVKPLHEMQLLVKPDADASPEDIEKHEPCVYKSWSILPKQACDLIHNLEADRLGRLSYHNLGNSQGAKSYNCLTWCEKHLASIGIDVSQQQSWLDVIVVHPIQHLPDSLDSDKQKLNSQEKCLMM